jgi:hypothetical protein
LSVDANAYPWASTQSEMVTSLAYCRRVPGDPETTRPPFHFLGRRITNWASWFQPWWVLNVDESGK